MVRAGAKITYSYSQAPSVNHTFCNLYIDTISASGVARLYKSSRLNNRRDVSNQSTIVFFSLSIITFSTILMLNLKKQVVNDEENQYTQRNPLANPNLF